MCLESLLQPLRCIPSITRETADNTAVLYWKISNLLVMCMLVRKGLFPAISVNKDVTVISDSSPPPWVPDPKGTQEGEVLRLLPADCSHSLLRALSNSGCERKRYWPQIAETGVKGMISVNPDSCIFPYMEKLNSLNWDIWFPLINNNLLMFRPLALCCKTSM